MQALQFLAESMNILAIHQRPRCAGSIRLIYLCMEEYLKASGIPWEYGV